jgi:hypothetical protein
MFLSFIRIEKINLKKEKDEKGILTWEKWQGKKKVCALAVRVWKIKWVAGNFVGLVTALEILRWLFYQKSSSIYKKKR